MKLFIVRHGETEWNTEGRFQGQIDTHLNQNGEKQADLVAERLKDIKFKCIFTSHLQRAFYTASEINKKSCSDRLIIDDRIIEINHGEWEGLLSTEIDSKWPGMLDMWHNLPHEVKMPGEKGESLNDIAERVVPFVESLFNSFEDDDNVLIVSHDAVIKVLFCYVIGTPLSNFWKFQIPNCSISIIEKNKGRNSRIILLSDANHINTTFNRSEQKGL